jgi:hypothetical protein
MVGYIFYIVFQQPIDSKQPTCMASHSQDIPHTLSTPEMSNSPQPEEEYFHPEIPYALPHEELNQFRRITRAYARQIGALSLALILPRRKKISRPWSILPMKFLCTW